MIAQSFKTCEICKKARGFSIRGPEAAHVPLHKESPWQSEQLANGPKLPKLRRKRILQTESNT